MVSTTKINNKKLQEALKVLVALEHDLRLTILKYINDRGVTNVKSVYNSLDLLQSLTSQQLKILKDTSLVVTKRKGKEIFYSVNYERLALLSQALSKFFGK